MRDHGKQRCSPGDWNDHSLNPERGPMLRNVKDLRGYAIRAIGYRHGGAAFERHEGQTRRVDGNGVVSGDRRATVDSAPASRRRYGA
jgi:hypothetical protein